MNEGSLWLLLEWIIGIILVVLAAILVAPYIYDCIEYSQLPDDYILTINGGKGTMGLKNGSYVEIPPQLLPDFRNQSYREWEWAMRERGITTYSDLKKYNSMMWSGEY